MTSTSNKSNFSRDDMQNLLRERSNWGRWGTDDQLGTLNLITPEKRQAAARLVRSGRTVSMSHTLFAKDTSPNNPDPATQQYHTYEREGTYSLGDSITPMYNHGYLPTHVDALNHMWRSEGMWGGRDPAIAASGEPVEWGDINAWSSGIVTRGVLIDIPKFRGAECVSLEEPVYASELEDCLSTEGVELEPGDAIAVYCGREAWLQQQKEPFYYHDHPNGMPGLHGSCLQFVREQDVSAVFWDMLESYPDEYGMGHTVHQAIWAFGLALVDNSFLAPLSLACQEEGSYEFMIMCAPLPIVGGTGSLVNPLAMF